MCISMKHSISQKIPGFYLFEYHYLVQYDTSTSLPERLAGINSVG